MMGGKSSLGDLWGGATTRRPNMSLALIQSSSTGTLFALRRKRLMLDATCPRVRRPRPADEGSAPALLTFFAVAILSSLNSRHHNLWNVHPSTRGRNVFAPVGPDVVAGILKSKRIQTFARHIFS